MGVFEKIFNKNSASLPANEEIAKEKSNQSSQEGGLVRKILSPVEKAAKLAAVLSILSGPLQASPEGESKEAGPEVLKNKIEEARLSLGKIVPFVEENDKSLVNTVGLTAVKTFEKNDLKITSAKDKSFIILSIGDGKYTYYDENSDGAVDRLVINEEANPEDRSSTKNGLFVFGEMDRLIKEAEVVADLKPEKITTFDFDVEKNEVTIVNNESGAGGVVGGERAEKAILKGQSAYAEHLQKIAAEQVK